MVLDAGALVAVDRRNRKVGGVLARAKHKDVQVVTSAAVVAQVWRNGSRQVNLARMLQGFDIRPLSAVGGRRIGELLAVTRTSDVVDAHVALLTRDDDVVLTSDPDDIERLVTSLGVTASIVKV